MVVFKLAGFLLVTVVAGLWITTRIIVSDIEREFPPLGDFKTIDGARIHFVDTGPGDEVAKPPVVFIHGASGNLRDAQHIYKSRLKNRLRMIFVDRPGHGYSDPFPGSNDPKQQAGVIADLLDDLGIERAIVVGHSFGGVVTAAFGVLHPEKTAGVVFLAPVSHPWPTGVDWHYDVGNMPVIGWLFSNLLVTPVGSLIYPKAVKGVFTPDKMPGDYKETSGTRLVLRPWNFLENARDVARVYDHVVEFNRRYREISAPTVIYHGDEDDIVNHKIHSVNGLSKDIKGAKLVILKGVGHKPDHVAADQVAKDILGMAGISDAGLTITSDEGNS
ncbi:MAG: alpha/beta fold hydrolase [Rhizobiaceae bacterium]